MFNEKAWYKIVFGFIKKKFVITMSFFSCNALNKILMKCVSMNNQECRVRSAILDINSNEPSFYPFRCLVNELCFKTGLMSYILA